MSELTGTPGGLIGVDTAERAEVRAEATSTTSSPRRNRRSNPFTPWLFLIVPLGLLILLTFLPLANMVWYGFTDWDGIDKEKNWVGFDNYVKLFTNPRYFNVFFVSLYYVAASVIQIALALFFATILSFRTRFRNLFKGIIFFPYLINGVAIAFAFQFFFRPDGTLDSILTLFGLGELSQQWLGNPDIINTSLAGTSVWRYLGLNFVLFLGAIQSIPGEIYEAADLDGANSWHKFRYIILPGIKRIVSLSFILAIAGSLSAFEIPFIMTKGANGSTTFVIQTIQSAFTFQQVGFASAMALVLLAIVLLVTWIQRRIVPDEKVDLT